MSIHASDFLSDRLGEGTRRQPPALISGLEVFLCPLVHISHKEDSPQ